MEKSQLPYTLGNWSVKPGNEGAFISEWKTFAAWTARNHPGAGTGYLLQDPEHPQQFVSFGSWESTEIIQDWRKSSEFQAFVTKVKTLCDGFQPHTLRLVTTSEQ